MARTRRLFIQEYRVEGARQVIDSGQALYNGSPTNHWPGRLDDVRLNKGVGLPNYAVGRDRNHDQRNSLPAPASREDSWSG